MMEVQASGDCKPRPWSGHVGKQVALPSAHWRRVRTGSSRSARRLRSFSSIDQPPQTKRDQLQADCNRNPLPMAEKPVHRARASSIRVP